MLHCLIEMAGCQQFDDVLDCGCESLSSRIHRRAATEHTGGLLVIISGPDRDDNHHQPADTCIALAALVAESAGPVPEYQP